MEIEDVSDGESLRAWLENQDSYEVSATIATRAALRAQPGLWAQLAPTRSDARLLAHQFFWSSMVSSYAAVCRSDDLRNVARAVMENAAARSVASFAFTDHSSFVPSAAATSAFAASETAVAVLAEEDATGAATNSAVAAYEAAKASRIHSTSHLSSWEMMRRDCRALTSGQPVWNTPLWSLSNGFDSEWGETELAWKASGAPWDTFARIYNDFWHGREPDWDYIERIVLIDPAVWEAGPEAVAEAIEIIDEQQRLAALAKEQLEKLHGVRSSRRSSGSPGLGHNNPPESLSDEANREILEAGASAARALEELDEELHKADPSSARVDESGNRLLKALSVFANYCGQKLDLAVDTLIKWGIPAGGVWLAANYTELTALANGAKALAKLLGN